MKNASQKIFGSEQYWVRRFILISTPNTYLKLQTNTDTGNFADITNTDTNLTNTDTDITNTDTDITNI